MNNMKTGKKEKYERINAINKWIIILVFLPISFLVIYPLLQRYFVKGVMLGAVKG